MKNKILKLKKKKNALIVAHYYTPPEVQEIADAVGDSYYLSKICEKSDKEIVVFCGVKFMAESAKVMSPKKLILLPDPTADCPMAEMVTANDIKKVRDNFENNLAVVCYINSTLEAKANSDVIVTSSNAEKIVSKLDENNIYFVPDENLGRHISLKYPEKNFILHNGYCHVHTSIDPEKLHLAKENHPNAKVLSHPECKTSILSISDFIGSTTGIIKEAISSEAKEFIICTEMGIIYDLEKKTKEKKFYFPSHRQLCPSMKKCSLERIYSVLEGEENKIEVDSKLAKAAEKALRKMHELGE